jgi:hypothetical protein
LVWIFFQHMCDELIRGVVCGDEIENENLLKYSVSERPITSSEQNRKITSIFGYCLHKHKYCSFLLLPCLHAICQDMLLKIDQIHKFWQNPAMYLYDTVDGC